MPTHHSVLMRNSMPVVAIDNCIFRAKENCNKEIGLTIKKTAIFHWTGSIFTSHNKYNALLTTTGQLLLEFLSQDGKKIMLDREAETLSHL